MERYRTEGEQETDRAAAGPAPPLFPEAEDQQERDVGGNEPGLRRCHPQMSAREGRGPTRGVDERGNGGLRGKSRDRGSDGNGGKNDRRGTCRQAGGAQGRRDEVGDEGGGSEAPEQRGQERCGCEVGARGCRRHPRRRRSGAPCGGGPRACRHEPGGREDAQKEPSVQRERRDGDDEYSRRQREGRERIDVATQDASGESHAQARASAPHRGAVTGDGGKRHEQGTPREEQPSGSAIPPAGAARGPGARSSPCGAR